MDATPYVFELQDGWPPDGEPGCFFGFDAGGNVAVLRWIDGRWRALRFMLSCARPIVPEYFQRGAGTEEYVVQWAHAPWAHGFEAALKARAEA